MLDTPSALTLAEAIASQSIWLRTWVNFMVAVHLLALMFIVFRENDRWRFRLDALLIVLSFFAGAVIMSWIYAQVGYERLLGSAHFFTWLPVWLYILRRRRQHQGYPVFRKYIVLYLLVAGTSLVLDAVDLLRYYFNF